MKLIFNRLFQILIQVSPKWFYNIGIFDFWIERNCTLSIYATNQPHFLHNFFFQIFIQISPRFERIILHWIHNLHETRLFFFFNNSTEPQRQIFSIEEIRRSFCHGVKAAAIRAYFTNKITAKDGPEPA